MKINILKYSLVLGLMSLLLIPSIAQELSKKVDKTYQVKSETTFTVENQFGKVHVNTWAKPEISVSVEVKVEGRTEARAQRLLDAIAIVMLESGNDIHVRTKMASQMNTNSGETFRINYTVYMPATNVLSVSNQFGDIYVDKRTGQTKVKCEHGNLKLEDQTFLDLEMAFSKGTTADMSKGLLELAHSGLIIGDADQLDLEQRFSDVEVGAVQRMRLDSKYGSMLIGHAHELIADVQYSRFQLHKLTGLLEMSAEYVGDLNIGIIQPSFSSVQIHAQYSNLNVNMAEGARANFEGEFSYGDLRSTRVEIVHRMKDGQRSEYKGSIGGGDTQKHIIIKSSYGDLRLK